MTPALSSPANAAASWKRSTKETVKPASPDLATKTGTDGGLEEETDNSFAIMLMGTMLLGHGSHHGPSRHATLGLH